MRSSKPCFTKCAVRDARSRRWSWPSPTSRKYSSRSCAANHDGLRYAFLQGSAAFLESELPDHRRPDSDRAAVSADLLARAGEARAGLSRRALHRVPGPGARDDVLAAECICEQLLEPD